MPWCQSQSDRFSLSHSVSTKLSVGHSSSSLEHHDWFWNLMFTMVWTQDCWFNRVTWHTTLSRRFQIMMVKLSQWQWLVAFKASAKSKTRTWEHCADWVSRCSDTTWNHDHPILCQVSLQTSSPWSEWPHLNCLGVRSSNWTFELAKALNTFLNTILHNMNAIMTHANKPFSSRAEISSEFSTRMTLWHYPSMCLPTATGQVLQGFNQIISLNHTLDETF